VALIAVLFAAFAPIQAPVTGVVFLIYSIGESEGRVDASSGPAWLSCCGRGVLPDDQGSGLDGRVQALRFELDVPLRSRRDVTYFRNLYDALFSLSRAKRSGRDACLRGLGRGGGRRGGEAHGGTGESVVSPVHIPAPGAILACAILWPQSIKIHPYLYDLLFLIPATSSCCAPSLCSGGKMGYSERASCSIRPAPVDPPAAARCHVPFELRGLGGAVKAVAGRDRVRRRSLRPKLRRDRRQVHAVTSQATFAYLRTFLDNHVKQIVAVDFFTVPRSPSASSS